MGTVTDYPSDLAAAHGRIAAYRAALAEAQMALTTAVPYVWNVAHDQSNAPWRRETAESSLAEIKAAQNRCAAELNVTSP